MNAALISNHIGWFIEVLMYLQAHPIVSHLPHATQPPITIKKGPLISQFNYFMYTAPKFYYSYDLNEFKAFLRSILNRYRPIIPTISGSVSVLDRIGSLEKDLSRENFLRDFSEYLSFPVSYMLVEQNPIKIAETLSSSVQAIKATLSDLDAAREKKKGMPMNESSLEAQETCKDILLNNSWEENMAINEELANE